MDKLVSMQNNKKQIQQLCRELRRLNHFFLNKNNK